MRIALAQPRRGLLGSLVIPKAADRQRPGLHLNRYPHQVIGLWVTFGGQRYLSWVWPVKLTGLRLTREQFNRHVRELIETEASR